MRINSDVSSEMFTGLMRVLHETLPCSKNYFHMKRKYKRKKRKLSGAALADETDEAFIKTIASPRMVRGLSIGKSPGRGRSTDGFSDNEGFSPTKFSMN